MKDVAPELYELLKSAFDQKFRADAAIKELHRKVTAGTASYREAHAFAIRVGELLSEAFGAHLSSAVLPDGKMYYNIAKSVVEPLLKGNYDLVTDVCGQVQKQINQSAGIGMNAIKPELNQDRIDGILNRISSETIFDDVAWILGEPVVNFTQSVVDDSVKANADFQYRSGLAPKITRISAGKCCKWCSTLAGTYDYDDVYDTGNDVFRRHENCRCLVLFKPGDGSQQNVHTKKWTDQTETAKIESRKEIIRKKSGLTQEQRVFIAKLEYNPKILGTYTPETLKQKLTELGFEAKPLGRGKYKNVPFEEGGGYKVNYRGDGYLQYHPEKGSRHDGAYYKLSSAGYGLRRVDLNGDEKP